MAEMYYLRSLNGQIDAETPLTLKVKAAGKELDNHTPDNPVLDLACALLTLMEMGWNASKAFVILCNGKGEHAKIELDRIP